MSFTAIELKPKTFHKTKKKTKHNLHFSYCCSQTCDWDKTLVSKLSWWCLSKTRTNDLAKPIKAWIHHEDDATQMCDGISILNVLFSFSSHLYLTDSVYCSSFLRLILVLLQTCTGSHGRRLFLFSINPVWKNYDNLSISNATMKNERVMRHNVKKDLKNWLKKVKQPRWDKFTEVRFVCEKYFM